MKPGLPITLSIDGVTVVVVGAVSDEESQRKLELLQESGAVLAQHATFDPAQLEGARLVLYVERDAATAAAIFAECRRRGILCWTADAPATSDFSMPAIARLGRARLGRVWPARPPGHRRPGPQRPAPLRPEPPCGRVPRRGDAPVPRDSAGPRGPRRGPRPVHWLPVRPRRTSPPA
jgi:siroheme synthase (precorrin-2 oxidase/ferrochelatase)